MKSSFLKAGHTPTLFAAFLYFDLSFMVWVMLGPLGVQIASELQLTPAQKGMMVATPVLAGALLRIVMGILVDHLRPKMAGIIGQVIVLAGSLVRPAGGMVADRVGGIKSLSFMYIFAALALFALTGLTAVKGRWRTTWGAAHMTTARV